MPASALNRQPDVIIDRTGGVFFFTPMTATARQWIEANVPLESWQWQGPSFAVEHRFAYQLAQTMLDAELEVE